MSDSINGKKTEAPEIGVDSPLSPEWRFDHDIHTNDQLEVWSNEQLRLSDQVLDFEQFEKEVYWIYPNADVNEAHKWLEYKQQQIDGYNQVEAEDGLRRCSFNRGITAEFWGFAKTEFTDMFANVSEQDMRLVTPRHIRAVLFIDGPYYGQRKGAAIDFLALPATEYTQVVGSVESFSDRVSKRTIAAGERQNPSFDPSDDKVRRGELHALRTKAKVMSDVVERIVNEDEASAALQKASRRDVIKKGRAFMSGNEMKDRIMTVINSTFFDMLRAMQLQLDWDNNTRNKAQMALWKTLFEDPTKRIANWQTMLSLGRSFNHARLNRYEPRLEDIQTRIASLSTETETAS